MANLKISENYQKGAVILTLSGRFDFKTQKMFRDAMKGAQKKGARHIVIDLKDVSFVDSTALGLIALGHQNLNKVNIKLSLANPQSSVQKTFDLADFSQMARLFPTLEEALASPACI